MGKEVQALLDDLAESSEESLAHYGVLGMKWGVRKSRSAVAKTKAESGEAKSKPDEKEETKPKSVKEMTNQEIREALERNRLEAEYNKLMQSPPSKKEQRKALVKSLVAQAARNAAAYALNQAGKAMADKMLAEMGIKTGKSKGGKDEGSNQKKSGDKQKGKAEAPKKSQNNWPPPKAPTQNPQTHRNFTTPPRPGSNSVRQIKELN